MKTVKQKKDNTSKPKDTIEVDLDNLSFTELKDWKKQAESFVIIKGEDYLDENYLEQM